LNIDEHRALWTLFGTLLTQQQFDRLDEVFASDVLAEFPQSGERFRGIQSMRAQLASYPGQERLETQMTDVIGGSSYALTPMYTVIDVEGTGDHGTAMFRSRYPDGSYWWVVNVYEVTAGRISRDRTFFAQEFEAPAWRAQFRIPS
jgi:hypothetical protein